MSVISMIAQPVRDLKDSTTLQLDLANFRARDVYEIIELFDREIRENPVVGDPPVVTGWNEITPAIAVQLLLRNRPHANRKIDPPTVYYYARQMDKGDWQATGQPVILDENGVLTDAQHRLLGVVISGVTITSFVVTGVKAIPNLFAYIDNSKTRTAAAALQTAGLNGVSSMIVKVIKFAFELDNNCYNPAGPAKPARMSPIEMLGLVAKYPNAKDTARAARTGWETMIDLVGGASKTHILATFAMQVIDLYGSDTGFLLVENFFEDVIGADVAAAISGDPLAALKKKLAKDLEAKVSVLKPHHVMAALIKTFNAQQKGLLLKGNNWVLAVDENMPTLDGPAPSSEEEAA